MEGRNREWTSWGFLIVAIILHGLFISSLWTGVLNWLFYDTQYLLGQGADFFAFYQAGNNVLNGLDCYAIPDSLVVPYLYLYRYLPYFAYSFGVIVNLAPPVLAYWLWVGVVTVSVWLAVSRTNFLARRLHRPEWEGRIAMGMWLVFSPIYIELYLGQVTLFAAILLFFSLTTLAFVDGPEVGEGASAALWTASGLTKLIPFLIAPVLLTAGRIRFVLVAAIVTVLAILVVPTGLESLRFFLDFNSARNSFIAPYAGSHSLKMLLFYLMGETTGDFRAVTVVLAGVFLVLSMTATIYSRDVWACAGLFASSYFFIMTDVWEHHYTFLLPFLVLAWIRGRPEDRARWIPLTVSLVLSLPVLPIVGFLSGASPGTHPITWGSLWQILYHSSKVVPALAFCGWLLVTAYRSPRKVSASVGDAFRSVWNGLMKGPSTAMEAGVLTNVESEKG